MKEEANNDLGMWWDAINSRVVDQEKKDDFVLYKFKLLRKSGASSIDTVFHLKKFPDLYNWLCVE